MSLDQSPILAIEGLEFSYGDKPLLKVDQFSATSQEAIAVLGPSGCGKTTFMHLISGLLRPQKGVVQVYGEDITQLSETEMDRCRGRHMGIVFQRFHLMPSISVMDNLLLAQRLARVEIDRTYASELLARLGIDEFSNRLPIKLSQGQMQRLAIARSVAHRPSLLIADEPTSALDDANAADAIGLLNRLAKESEAALIVVTHDERVRTRVGRVYEMESAA